MKTLITIFTIVLIGHCAYAQKVKESQVPAPVVSAFHKQCPAVKDYSWSLEDGNYEAEYDVNKMEYATSFDKNGNLLETEKEIAVKDLPAGCAEYVSKNYPGTTIKEASEMTDAKGVKTYEAETKAGDLVFDAKGNFLKLEKD